MLPFALTLQNRPKMTPTSSPPSLLVGNLGLMDTRSGRRQIHRDSRKHNAQNNVKSMLICFIDTEGIMHKEFVPPGQTLNGNFYCNVLRWLRENVQRKRPVKWCNNSWALNHDNAPTHMSLPVRQFLTSTKMTVFLHLPNSLTHQTLPVTFFLFLKMKLQLKARHFESIQEIQAKSQEVMKQNDFHQCY
jgi:hypothetical protein